MFKPLNNKILIKPCDRDSDGNSYFGYVIAISDKLELPIKIDDMVAYPKYGGSMLMVGDEEMLIIDADEIYGVYE